MQSNDKKGTLGSLISHEKIKLPQTIKDAIKKLYGFASDEGGIRHGNKDISFEIRRADALFICVTCAAIVNYMIQLSNSDI